MATFSNIPELSVAEVLSGTMGNLVGSLSGKATSTLNKLNSKLFILCERASAGDRTVLSEIGEIENTLNSVEKTVDSLDKSLSTVKRTAATVEAPAKALNTALRVAKHIPMPVPPPVPALIALLSELIAQVKQIAAAMKSVAKTLQHVLDLIRNILRRLQQTVQAIKASIALLLSGGNNILKEKGIENSDGTNILGNVGAAISAEGISLISIGGVEITQSISSSGDWVSTVYKESETRPETPVSRDFQPEGWTLTEPVSTDLGESLRSALPAEDLSSVGEYAEIQIPVLEDGSTWWYTTATISGETNKVNGSWSKPERYTGIGGSGETLNLGEKREYNSKDIITVDQFLQGMYGTSGAIVLIENSEDAYNFLVDLVGIINASGISLEVQEEFRKSFGEQALDDTKHFYTTPSGNILELKVVKDPKSPSIAPLYYVTATDTKTNTVVYTGTKTFATDEEILIDETIVRLNRILLNSIY